MTENEMMEKLLYHDGSLNQLAGSVEILASSHKDMNQKLDVMVNGMQQLNVLLEKIGNIDSNVRESFNRVHKRIDNLEDTQDDNGCMALANARKDIDKTGQDRLFRGIGVAFSGMIILTGWVLTEIYQNENTISLHLDSDAEIITELYMYIDEHKADSKASITLLEHKIKELRRVEDDK